MSKTQMPATDRQRLLLAIDDCEGIVTPGDLAQQTGMPIEVVRQQVNKLASQTGCRLDVTAAGNIIYKFPRNMTQALASKDAALQTERVKRVLKWLAFFCLRVMFGVILMATIWLFKPPWNQPRALFVYVAFLFGVAWGETDQSAEFRKGNDEAYLKTADILGLGNLLNIFSLNYHWRNRRLENALDLLKEQPARERKATFVTACFSFVFGDGNPNYLFDDLSWQVIAEVIRQNRGAVVFEQLAPYLNLNLTADDEDAIIPVLERFEGHPEVTRSGNIVYVFPNYQSNIKAVSDAVLPQFIAEREWKFSELSFPYLLPVWVVSSLIFGLSFMEWRHPDLIAWISWLPPGFTLWQVMLPFSGFFLGVPLCRFLLITAKNAQINLRNQWRHSQARILKAEQGKLPQKLLEREAFIVLPAPREHWKLDYTTSKDVIEQHHWNDDRSND